MARARPLHSTSMASGDAVLCMAGAHELCAAWLAGDTITDDVLAAAASFHDVARIPLGHPPADSRRCGCACHREPWPFEHDG